MWVGWTLLKVQSTSGEQQVHRANANSPTSAVVVCAAVALRCVIITDADIISGPRFGHFRDKVSVNACYAHTVR